MLRPLLIAFCIFALAACSTATRPTTIEVSGTLFYLERIALPPDALVQVELRDVSQGTDKVLVVQAKSGEAGPPFPFKLSVPAPASDAQPSLALYASIRSSDRLIFATGAPVPIPAEGAAGLQVRLVMAPQTSSLTDQ
jgi:putative lipoprotein